MSDTNWNDVGDKIKDAVDSAISTGDFSKSEPFHRRCHQRYDRQCQRFCKNCRTAE